MTVKICADCIYKSGAYCTKQWIEPKIDLVTGRVIERASHFHCETQRMFSFDSCGREGKWFKAKKESSNEPKQPNTIQRAVQRLLRMLR